MPFWLKMAVLGSLVALLAFGTQSSGSIDPNLSPQGIYPNGGTDPPPPRG